MNTDLVPFEVIGVSPSFAPDYLSSEDSIPAPNHVISRNKQGEVLSTFSNNIWDFSIYTSRGCAKLNFEGIFESVSVKKHNSSLADSILKDAKKIVLNLWYRRQLSVNSIMALWIQIKYISRYAYQLDVSINQVLADLDYFEYRLSGSSNRYQEWSRLAGIQNLITHLTHINHQVKNFNIAASSRFIQRTSEMAREREDEKISNRIQTPVIPSRILSEAISQNIQTCSIFLDNIHVLKFVFSEFEKIRKQAETGEVKLGRWRGSKSTLACQVWKFIIKNNPDYKSILIKSGIENIQDVSSYLAYIQKSSSAMIAQFTGMRVSEIRAIPLNGFKSYQYGGEEIWGFNSYTFKFSGSSPKSEFWITSVESELFYQAAKASSELIYKYKLGVDINDHEPGKLPLFPGRSGWINGVNGLFDVPPMNDNFGWRASIKFTPNYNAFFIIKDDIQEIKKFNPWVDFSKKNIIVGAQYPFAWHMHRRSLVVYAARSGVSLPILSYQLKHPIEQMTLYYANDSIYAKNFIDRSKNNQNKNQGLINLVDEFQEELLLTQVDLLLEDITDYDGVLFGGAGASLQRAKNKNGLPSIYEDSAVTELEIKAGRIAYRRTAVGGCASIKACDRIAFTSVLACIDCDSSVFNDKTVDIMEDQIFVWEEEIMKYGESSPFSKQRRKEILIIERHLKMRNNLIRLQEVT